MLFIVMHTNDEYLSKIHQLIKEQDVIESAIVEREGLGASIAGGNDFNIFNAGHMLPKYNKAVIAVIEDINKAKQILKVINTSIDLKMLNMENKGFICSLPYKEIVGLGKKLKKGEIMKISDYLKEDMVIMDLKAEQKNDAIGELGEIIRKSKSLTDYDSFMRDVFDREDMYTTGIGNEVALPHARTDAVNDFIIAFGRSKKGIEFKSIDQKPVKIVFLMGTPQNSGITNYLHVLAHLNRLLQKNDFRQELINSASPAEIIEIFKKAEK
ncbi:MAG: PTS sugar transporter subunit IIA [Elusimicrobiota bacterium]